MRDHELASLKQVLWPKGPRRDVWMIVDAARDRRIFGLLLDCFYSDHTCLFGSPLPPALEVASPYLVRLEYDGAKTARFLSEGWGNGWGILLRSNWGQTDLERHLRELLIVAAPNGRQMVFRYYDPRVLRAYLPTCTPNELRTVFGGIECFWMEDGGATTLVNAAIEQSALAVTQVHLQ